MRAETTLLLSLVACCTPSAPPLGPGVLTLSSEAPRSPEVTPPAGSAESATPSASAAAPDGPPTRRTKQPSRVDGSLVPIPPTDLDDELAGLPTDVRVANEPAFSRTHMLDCASQPGVECERRADLDGNGSIDRVVGVRSRASKEQGLAVFWADGSISIIGAGTRSRQFTLDIHEQSVDAAWRLTALDHLGIEGARIAERAPRAANFRLGRDAREVPAPGATGAGILLDGGDAAEVLYWTGTGWRVLLLGF